jgi:hypothetical protein
MMGEWTVVKENIMLSEAGFRGSPRSRTLVASTFKVR